jgi:Concanavalin A-like lectin/glucanases superfamily/Secretion system C-terminal sorting domain
MKKLILLPFCLFVTLTFGQLCIPNSNSLQFNGTVSSADCTTDNNLVITDSITIEAWINAATWASIPAQGTIVCKHNWSSNEQGYVLRAGGTGTLSFAFAGLDTNGTPLSWIDTQSSTTMSLNTWYHVAATYDGTVSRIYINGALAGSTNFTGSMVPSTVFPLKVGKLSFTTVGQGRFWNGKIDEVRIWHRALSQTEISSQMSMHIDTATANGMVGYWRFNEGTGITANDLTASNNDLNLASTIWSTNVPFVEQPQTPIVQNFPQLLNCLSTGVTYQWNLAGVPILNATQQLYIPTQSGSYTVTVSGPSGCTATSNPVQYTVGIDELNLDTYYNISPNPTNGDFVITILRTNEYNNYEIHDLEGRILQSGNIAAGKMNISLDGVAKGCYLVVLKGESSTHARKIILK